MLQCLRQKDATLKEIYEHLNKQYELSTINGVLAYLVKEQKVSTIITNGIKKYKYNI
jgi:predicted transcriptional regulator